MKAKTWEHEPSVVDASGRALGKWTADLRHSLLGRKVQHAKTGETSTIVKCYVTVPAVILNKQIGWSASWNLDALVIL